MALKEVREMVSEMRGTKLEEEMIRIKQILKAAEIEFEFEGTVQVDEYTASYRKCVKHVLERGG